MKKKNQTDALKESISLLQIIQANKLKQLNEQAKLAYESLKPINMIKNTFHEITSSPDLKNNILSNVIGLATGYLSRRVLMGVSHNPIKRILGTAFQLIIANVATQHADAIKLTGEKLLLRIINYK